MWPFLAGANGITRLARMGPPTSAGDGSSHEDTWYMRPQLPVHPRLVGRSHHFCTERDAALPSLPSLPTRPESTSWPCVGWRRSRAWCLIWCPVWFPWHFHRLLRHLATASCQCPWSLMAHVFLRLDQKIMLPCHRVKNKLTSHRIFLTLLNFPAVVDGTLVDTPPFSCMRIEILTHSWYVNV